MQNDELKQLIEQGLPGAQVSVDGDGPHFQALIVSVGKERYAIPLNAVLETLLCEPQEIQRSEGREILNLRGEALDLLQFHAWAYGDPAWLDALFHLQELKEEGLIRRSGWGGGDGSGPPPGLRRGS